MRLPQEVIDRLLEKRNEDLFDSLGLLARALTGLVNWTLIVFATTSIYRAVIEIAQWFR